MLYRSTLVSDARGSAGGLTASRNRSGNYLRKRIKPTNTLTSDRTRARNDLSGAAAEWPALTDAQRAGWNGFAASQNAQNSLGETIHLSGENWFVRINAMRSLGGLTLQTTPPPSSGSTLLTDIAMGALDESTFTLGFTQDNANDWAVQDDGRLFIFATQPLSPGRISTAGSFRFVGMIEGNTAAPPADVQSFVLPIGRRPIATQAQFFRFVAMDEDGRLSVQQVKRAIAVP